jgi:hypothetical protein
MADDTRLRNDLDYLERQKAAEYAPLGVSLGGPPTASFGTLPNGSPAPYPQDVEFGATPTAAFGAPPVAQYGMGAGQAGAGPLPYPGEAPYGLEEHPRGYSPIAADQGVTPEMAHQAASKVLPDGSPAPFYVDDSQDQAVMADEGRPALGPVGQAMQGYQPPVMPTNQPEWFSPTQSGIAALPSQQPIDPWFSALTPEEQRMVGGQEAARPRGGPLSGNGGINPFGQDTENEIARLRQQYEQAIRGNYR